MSRLQHLLAQTQAQAFQKPHLPFASSSLDSLAFDLAGLNGHSNLVPPSGCAGEMRLEDSIRANPPAYSSYPTGDSFDTIFLSQQLQQMLRLRALASSYLSPRCTQSLDGQITDDLSPVQQYSKGFNTLMTHPVPVYSSNDFSSINSKGSNRNLGKKQASQKLLADKVRRTVYICDIHQQVTEEQLASCFQECGQVVDCRICGDPNSAMRFAFIEFLVESAVQNALAKSGSLLGSYPLRVLPSKTAIVPVNNQYLPKTMQERELCGRTIYAANIDKKVDRAEVQAFFERLCGPVSKLRLLGDYHHPTRIAFVEFYHADSARAALNCSGALLGSLPVRVSPSKTPVRPDPRHDDLPTPSL